MWLLYETTKSSSQNYTKTMIELRSARV